MLIYLYTTKKSNAVCWKGAEKMNAKKMIKAVILGMAAVAVLSAAGCSDGNKVPTQGAVQKESPLMHINQSCTLFS